MASFLRTLQTEIRDRLANDPLFASVNLTSQLRGDIETGVDVAVDRLSAGGLVLTPTATGILGSLPHPTFDAIPVVVRFWRDNTVAADLPDAVEMAERALALLQNWTPVSTGQALRPAEPTIEVSAIVDQDGRVMDNLDGWQLTMLAAGGYSVTIPELDPPALAVAAGTLTITPPDVDGVAVFYTITEPGGTVHQPMPRGQHEDPPWAFVYTAPVDVSGYAAGTKIRAKAILAGYHDSTLVTVTL